MEEAAKIGQSIDTGNIGNTGQRQTKQKYTTQKTKKMNNTDPTKKRR